MPPATSPFAALATTAAAVGATRSKNAKRDLLAAYLRGLPPKRPRRGDASSSRDVPSSTMPPGSVSAGCSRVPRWRQRAAPPGRPARGIPASFGLRRRRRRAARAAAPDGHSRSQTWPTRSTPSPPARSSRRSRPADERAVRPFDDRGGAVHRRASRLVRPASACGRGCWRRRSPPPSTSTWPRCDGRTC